MKEKKIRQAIIDACLKMNSSGLNQGTSGNISVRHGDGLLVTPSGIAYESLEPDDLIHMSMDGKYDHKLDPTSEWRFHRDIIKNKPDVNAVVHCHPPFGTSLAIRRMEIPALHYMIAVGGGNSIPCCKYATYGTPELSKEVIKVLKDRSACLMANHGMIATGPNLDKAMWLAIEVETLARQYVHVLQMGAEPVLLPDDEINRVLEKFKSYGLRQKADA